MFLKKIQDKLSKEGIPFAIVGGYAVAIHGVARGTFDLDVITEISEENFLKLESILGSIGLKSILPISATEIFRNLELYQREKNLIAWNFVNPERQRESLDIILTEDIRNCKIEQVKTDFGSLTVISLEDLIRMKSKTNRAQDIEDVRALRKLK
ncbi:hypothetical protein LEP1GSC202_3553 [Leptospira yanagawae serovar Saopaulo str. Sao Paulo = ATCC 700523]|uniref:DUF6036 domain-containing protein n=1 Tax=Leptospira yanagawae serovar Saopaulo str. Sao Paulo = ATCC 700523 TaxID=1249483 RepID=A0A5E8H7X4_9LEPT|nr:DUF6036 family nucleotidyltransferase [Leptospira yanagawae]EOQ87284.1 hypothetical protein LEP1GSC202_3553 [Leptospira yanagawae serovar Saopaulo str. Sao Paulo = ATCC 700523]